MGASVTVYLKNPETEKMENRTFWVCARNSPYGYVYETTHKPGTLGRQVNDALENTGDMLMCRDDGNALRNIIKAAQRKRLRQYKKMLAQR